MFADYGSASLYGFTAVRNWDDEYVYSNYPCMGFYGSL